MAVAVLAPRVSLLPEGCSLCDDARVFLCGIKPCVFASSLGTTPLHIDRCCRSYSVDRQQKKRKEKKGCTINQRLASGARGFIGHRYYWSTKAGTASLACYFAFFLYILVFLLLSTFSFPAPALYSCRRRHQVPTGSLTGVRFLHGVL